MGAKERIIFMETDPEEGTLTPATGVAAGGTVVSIAGSSFLPGATVTFDGLPGTVGVITPTTISVTTPAHVTGAVPVVVTNPDGEPASLANAFTYT